MITKGEDPRREHHPWPKSFDRGIAPRRFNHFQIPDIGRSPIHATTSTLANIGWYGNFPNFHEIRDGCQSCRSATTRVTTWHREVRPVPTFGFPLLRQPQPDGAPEKSKRRTGLLPGASGDRPRKFYPAQAHAGSFLCTKFPTEGDVIAAHAFFGRGGYCFVESQRAEFAGGDGKRAFPCVRSKESGRLF